ncbi:lipopolysaccharide biosynthesis protein [Lysobacter silvisoli]|uniref:Flippase n=1 Tax=Lysobacter silvisoli TaxID=2293254 RepID=A0A371K0P5_9GAMM|nr:polysaccharide biosynthesis C-terminal domain-containing protein [Lysobacter silvisoli]RDZ27430.1 flippase [Lysobacter silvisoli]
MARAATVAMNRGPARAWRGAAAAIALLWLATAAGAVMVFLAQSLLARRLGTHSYGLFASSLATVSMVAPLAGFGLSQFRLKAYGREGWGAERWLRPSLRFSLSTTLLALAGIAAWACWGYGVDAQTRATLLALLPVVLGLFAVDLVGSKLRLEERHRALAAWQLLIPGGRLLVAALAFAAASVSALQVALGYGLVAVAALALAAPQLRAIWRGRIDLQGHGPRADGIAISDDPSVAQLTSQAWAYGLAAVLYPVFFQIGTVLLKYLGNDAMAGRYGVALAVMTAVYLFPAVVYQKFLLARLHRWAAHEPDRFWRVHRLGNLAMLAAGLATGIALAALSPWLVPLAFGEAYRGAALVLAVLAVCAPIRFLSTSVGSALLTEGHMRQRVYAMLAAAVAAIALNAVLIPRYGELGAAWATVAAEALLLLAMWRSVRRIAPRRETP